MSRRALPLIVGSLVILAVVGYVYLHQSSPGELARAHASVAGSSFIMDCKKCHDAKGLSAGCLQCHSEIQEQLKAHRGYHDYLAQSKKTECAKCHSEHNGADFALVNQVSWEGKDVKSFKHPHVAYRLIGFHADLACDKCHQAKSHPAFSLPKFPKHVRPHTYLGLSQTCMSCHADPHAGGKASNCTECHDQNHWKPAPFFNHDKFYPLRGAHASVSCNKCHAPSQITRQSPSTKQNVVFGPTKGKRCTDCHASPHRVKWVETCEACHVSNDKAWNNADHRMTRKQHALSGFRLEVPHDKAKCLDCHGPDRAGVPFSARYPDPSRPGYKRFEKNCEACHKDEHRGQFVKNHPRCMDCHNRTAFMPAAYGAKDHKTYPLIGGHLKAACSSCHLKERETKMRRFVPTPRDCTACHKDIHYGQLRKANGQTRCEDCHASTVQWSMLIFNHNTQSRFKLDDAHKNVVCKACHPVVSLENGVQLTQYKPIKSQCSDCHALDELNSR